MTPVYSYRGLTQATQQIQEFNSYRVGPVKREQNYGLLTIDWGDDNKQQTTIRLQGFGKGNALLMERVHSQKVDAETPRVTGKTKIYFLVSSP